MGGRGGFTTSDFLRTDRSVPGFQWTVLSYGLRPISMEHNICGQMVSAPFQLPLLPLNLATFDFGLSFSPLPSLSLSLSVLFSFNRTLSDPIQKSPRHPLYVECSCLLPTPKISETHPTTLLHPSATCTVVLSSADNHLWICFSRISFPSLRYVYYFYQGVDKKGFVPWMRWELYIWRRFNLNFQQNFQRRDRWG